MAPDVDKRNEREQAMYYTTLPDVLCVPSSCQAWHKEGNQADTDVRKTPTDSMGPSGGHVVSSS